LFFNNIKKKLVTTDKLEVQIHFYGACWNKIVRRSLSEKLIYGEVGATPQKTFHIQLKYF